MIGNLQQKQSSGSVPVFGWLWGGNTLGREALPSQFKGASVWLWKYENTVLCGYGFHASLCRMVPETQLSPASRDSNLWEMHPGQLFGPGDAALSPCPCSLVFGTGGESGWDGERSWEMKWGRKASRESFIRYIFVFQVPIISRKLLLKSPPFTLSPN